MTALLTSASSNGTDRSASGPSPADRLRNRVIVRVQFKPWLGTEKSLSPEQRAQAAQPFSADARNLRAAKKILDVKNPAYRAVTSIRGKAEDYYKSLSTPYVEPGVRLMPREKRAEFQDQMDLFRVELDDAVSALDARYFELREQARRALGDLFNPADYPVSLVGAFGVTYDYPNLGEPPSFLVEDPEEYTRQSRLIRDRFEQAVVLAEEAFLGQFADCVRHICERLDGTGDDGTPRVFRDTLVTNLVDFVEQFRLLNLNSNEQLDQLVERAQGAIRGVSAQDLRDSAGLRERVAGDMARVQVALDRLMSDQPRRRILRSAATPREA
jgi:hypothetical protein